MKTLTYKNKTRKKLVVVGVGVVKAGKTVEVTAPINNPHLELVEPDKSSKPKQESK